MSRSHSHQRSRPFRLGENWTQKLRLSQPLNHQDNQKHILAPQWFCSIDIGEWKEVEIFIEGDERGPNKRLIEKTQQIGNECPKYVQAALKYLDTFMPTQKADGYELSSISFGMIVTVDAAVLQGFSLSFLYGDDLEAFQFKVKFKEDGWPIGFEGGPL